MNGCATELDNVGNGIAAALRGVDCLAADATQAAFGRLFGAGGALVPALTILLTLFVALFAFGLLTGRSRIGVAALTPRMMTLGLVLTFATSWVAYQSVVWTLATGAADQIASIITGSEGSATTAFADKIDIAFAAIGQIAGPEQQQDMSMFSPPGLLWLGATLLLLGTVGILVTTRIALAVLVAVGPVFVVMALFPGTRGLFAGWLKGLVLLAIAPLFAVLGGGMMLELAVPVLNALGQTPGQIDPRAAMGFFLIGAVHVALMMLAINTATAMVADWDVFGLAATGAESRTAAAAQSGAAPPAPAASAPPPAPAVSTDRRIAQAIPVPAPANDRFGSAPPAPQARDFRITAHTAHSAGQPAANAGRSRAHGIGSRFRSAPARSTEKLK
ncbi:type IV secretion system protein [Croceicoccus sp. YJ47]|uniref:type IV secretion system protein n=1 Tax=Croceicoccus sp. YJ47 TaxID=2798724 RepID=UPI0019233058|nr:type IV secretion system protein [Croceicoccus sp. YJ47]QQN74470.1 type IV secretion system protein [Croceicoccus sp. YJ47]